MSQTGDDSVLPQLDPREGDLGQSLITERLHVSKVSLHLATVRGHPSKTS